MVKIRRLVKQIFQTFLKLVLAGKWLTPIVFAVTIIQLLSRKGARYAFNMSNRYLITQTKKYKHDKKCFFDKVFETLWNSFRILSSLSMKYCHMRKKKTLVMYRVSITKRPREIGGRYLNKEKWHSQVIWMFSTFRKYYLLPEKEIWQHCSFTHTFEEKKFLSLQMQRRASII